MFNNKEKISISIIFKYKNLSFYFNITNIMKKKDMK